MFFEVSAHHLNINFLFNRLKRVLLIISSVLKSNFCEEILNIELPESTFSLLYANSNSSEIFNSTLAKNFVTKLYYKTN